MAVIGINSLFLVPKDVGGTEYHLRSFLRELERQDTKNSYRVFCNQENYETFSFTNPRWKKVHCPVPARFRVLRLLYEQFVLPVQCWLLGITVLHSYGYFGPVLLPCKSVVTVHDANWLDHPEDGSTPQQFVLDVLIRLSVTRAQYVITDSEFSKSRLVHHLPQLRQKLKVLSPGVELEFLRLLTLNTRPKVHEPYVLCVSALYPHKRVPYLLDLWKRVYKELPNSTLVLVGKNGADEQEVRKRVKRQKNVKHFASVSFPQLVSLYAHARAFVHPSVYEGFGYPVYEALAAGLPTYVGNTELYSAEVQSELKQLTGDADRDSAMLVRDLQKKLGKKKQRLSRATYESSVKKLIRLYQAL